MDLNGAVYHVITRGINRGEIFRDDADREEFLRRMEIAIEETGAKCYGWVLMPNHLHLIIRTGLKPLSDLLRKVLTGYAIYFNHKYQRSGYLYQNRYKSILCQEDKYLLELVRYIHLNPLRARLVKDLAGLEKYEWSGHLGIIGKRNRGFQTTGEILERFGRSRKEAVKRYWEYLEAGKDMGKREDLSGGGLRRSAGGWAGVRDLRKSKEYWRGDERILGEGDFVNAVLKKSEEEMVRKQRYKTLGITLERLVEKVCALESVEKKDLLRKGKANRISRAKELLAYWGNKELGISGREIGKYLGITRPAISRLIRNGEARAGKEALILTF